MFGSFVNIFCFSIHITHCSVNFTWFALLSYQRLDDRSLFQPGERWFSTTLNSLKANIFREIKIIFAKPYRFYILGKKILTKEIFFFFFQKISPVFIECSSLINRYEDHRNKFPDFFCMVFLLIVHTWHSSPLRSNLLRLQCTYCTIPTTSAKASWKSSCVSMSITFVTASFILLNCLITTASELRE